MKNIIAIAIQSKLNLTEESLQGLLEVIERSENSTYATELVLGIAAKPYTVEELLSMKSSKIELFDNQVSFNPWENSVSYNKKEPVKIDGYSLSKESNQPIENMVALYNSANKKLYPEIPTGEEYEKANEGVELYNRYFLTGDFKSMNQKVNLSTWING